MVTDRSKEKSLVLFSFIFFIFVLFFKEPDKKYNSEECVVYPRLHEMGCCSILFTKLMLFKWLKIMENVSLFVRMLLVHFWMEMYIAVPPRVAFYNDCQCYWDERGEETSFKHRLCTWASVRDSLVDSKILVFPLTQCRNLLNSLSSWISSSHCRPHFSHCLRHLFFPVGLPWHDCLRVNPLVNPTRQHVDLWVSWPWQAWRDPTLTMFTKKSTCFFCVSVLQWPAWIRDCPECLFALGRDDFSNAF